MPTYSYKCKKCNKVFDAFHSMSCTDPQHCPECNGEGHKLMSASSVIFKGSGFYSTDYRDSGYLEAKRNEQDKKSESKDNKSSKDSKDTKDVSGSDSGGTSKKDTPAAKSDSKVPAAA